MTAITPTVVQKGTDEVQDSKTGTAVRIVEFTLKATKTAQNETIVTTTALGAAFTTDKIIDMSGICIPTGGDAVIETLSLDDSDDEIVLANAAVGTVWLRVRFGF